MTKKVAQELIDATPKKLRGAFMKRRNLKGFKEAYEGKSKFYRKAMAGLQRLPKMDAAIWDRQGIYRESGGDQRRAPFRGGQSAGVRRIMDAIDSAADRKFGSIRNAIRQSPDRKISLASLHGLQAAVDANKVKGKIEDIERTDEVEVPAVVRFKGKLYLVDGYHTCTALKLGGVKSVVASVAAL
jgi:hypothetical protein